jgi:hypothetical protein
MTIRIVKGFAPVSGHETTTDDPADRMRKKDETQ